jgi:CRP-like cAMP-binding protein
LQGKVKVTKKEYVEPTEEELKSGKPIEYYVNMELIRLGTGACFGELALKNDDKRQATLTTVEDTHFAILDKEPFQLILKDIDQKVAYLQAFSSMKLFLNWQYTFIKNLYDLCSEKMFAINNVIYREGDEAELMFFIKSGEFALKVGILQQSQDE